jgi:hypothetical protein
MPQPTGSDDPMISLDRSAQERRAERDAMLRRQAEQDERLIEALRPCVAAAVDPADVGASTDRRA